MTNDKFTFFVFRDIFIHRDTRSTKRCLDDDDYNDYIQRIFPTPESSKRRKSNSIEDDQTPPSRIVSMNNTLNVPDSTTSFTDIYESQFQTNFYDPNLYTSPYSRLTSTYPFAYTPMASTPHTNPFSLTAATASRYSSTYSFSPPYYPYSALS